MPDVTDANKAGASMAVTPKVLKFVKKSLFSYTCFFTQQ
jgi:hypothetical protein